jgi:two-component system, OmpR family, response regulator ChvI
MSIPLRKDAGASLPSRHACTANQSIRPRIRVVLVDDDEAYAEAVAEGLGQFGFEVTHYPSGELLLDNPARLHEADVIVLDWRLPTGPGTELMRQLRERGVDLPVVFLSGVPRTTYEATALDRGAVDFVDKARGLVIIAKRLRMVVGWTTRENSHRVRPVLQCGPLELHPELMRATWKGADLDLTLTEFNIVYLLASRSGEYVTYRAVYDCVHGVGFVAGSGEDGFRANVRSSIKRIRIKFRAVDHRFHEIENFAAVGYCWRQEITPAETDSEDSERARSAS